ncbi:MAG: hypothetical protein M3O67_10560 [Bacteroidota bacterium]|nr:hypothetical protein [Bacteroidota bacterium]
MHGASLFHSTGLLQIKKRAVKKKKNENGVIVWLICVTQQEVSNFFMYPTSSPLFNTSYAVPRSKQRSHSSIVRLAWHTIQGYGSYHFTNKLAITLCGE